MCLFTLVSIIACSTDYDVNFVYRLNCSADLLQFVTPVVKITNSDGTIETIELNDSDWDKSGNSTVEIKTSTGSVSSSQSVYGYIWTKTLYYNVFGVYTSMEVSYEQKTDMPQINPNDSFIFCHDLSCTVSAIKEEKGFFKGTSQDVNSNMEVNIPNYELINGSDVEKYIEKLIITPDKKTCSVDGDGNIKRQ